MPACSRLDNAYRSLLTIFLPFSFRARWYPPRRSLLRKIARRNASRGEIEERLASHVSQGEKSSTRYSRKRARITFHPAPVFPLCDTPPRQTLVSCVLSLCVLAECVASRGLGLEAWVSRGFHLSIFYGTYRNVVTISMATPLEIPRVFIGCWKLFENYLGNFERDRLIGDDCLIESSCRETIGGE